MTLRGFELEHFEFKFGHFFESEQHLIQTYFIKKVCYYVH